MQNQLLLDYEQTDENYIDHIQKVTKDDVISMANKARTRYHICTYKGDHS